MARLTIKAIEKAIGDERIELIKGDGYYWFAFDNEREIYETHSVYVNRLNDLTLETWLYEAEVLMKKVKRNFPGKF